jgi:hypothetical protein
MVLNIIQKWSSIKWQQAAQVLWTSALAAGRISTGQAISARAAEQL